MTVTPRKFSLWLLVALTGASCGGRTPLEIDDEDDGARASAGGTNQGAAGAADGGATSHAGASGSSDASPCPALPGPPLAPFPRADGSVQCIDATEVTNDDYAAFLGDSGGSSAPQPAVCSGNTSLAPLFGWPAPSKDALNPVVNVDWCDARAYCAWAGKHLCGSPKPNGGATPWSKVDPVAESAWQMACSRDGHLIYPYGNHYDRNKCNGKDAASMGTLIEEGGTCEGGYDAIYDLSGNVWEWQDDCESEDAGAECLVRGGSFRSDELSLTCSSIEAASRMSAFDDFGFRCCY